MQESCGIYIYCCRISWSSCITLFVLCNSGWWYILYSIFCKIYVNKNKARLWFLKNKAESILLCTFFKVSIIKTGKTIWIINIATHHSVPFYLLKYALEYIWRVLLWIIQCNLRSFWYLINVTMFKGIFIFAKHASFK